MYDTVSDSQNKKAPVGLLVVDDELEVRSLLSDILNLHEYHVDLAEDSTEALEMLSEGTYSVMLLDARLPGISGFELLKYCKKYHPHMEIIMMTGAPEIEDAINTVRDGAFDYLPKPFSTEKLLQRVSDAVKKYDENCEYAASVKKEQDPNGYEEILPNSRLIRTLGSGTMGVVLLVEKDSMRYALKILRHADADDLHRMRVKRFLQEAEILSRLNDRNVVHIYRASSPDAEVPFILMEYVDGKPLTEIIRKGTADLKLKINLIRQIASALRAIHNHQIVHRDVKPENVLVTSQNIVKLTDFGIARSIGTSLTMTHDIIGSPAYMSPEAFVSGASVDSRSDLFSLGIVAYELITGVKPFVGESVVGMMSAIRNTHPVDPMKLVPDLPVPIRGILGRLLQKNPSNRYQSAVSVIRDLDLYASGKSRPLGLLSAAYKRLRGAGNQWS